MSLAGQKSQTMLDPAQGVEHPSLIGSSITRIDLRAKVTGSATYARDMKLPFMLYAKLKRCPFPHARIISIDDSDARKVIGVRAIVTGRDFPQLPNESTPALAMDEAYYHNQGVLAVAADTAAIAEEAISAIKVEYERLPAVFDPELAMSKDSPCVIVHPGEVTEAPNVGRHVKVISGDVERAFKECEYVIEGRYSTARISHFQLEPITFLAHPDAEGGVTVWGSFTSSAHTAQQELAIYLGIDPANIRVIVPFLGGCFGAKEESHIAAICAKLALVSGRPVKLELSREESMTATATRHATLVYIKDGYEAGGKLAAREIRAIYNGGAFGILGNNLLRNGLLASVSVYNVPNIKFDGYRVYTNTVPGSAQRAPMGTQIDWAVECHMDYASQILHEDPVQLRLKNVLLDENENAIGEAMEGTSHRQCLLEVVRRMPSGASRKKSDDEVRESDEPGLWREGTGYALAAKWAGTGLYQATVRVRASGVVEVSADVVENGQGSYTGLVQIAAEEFGVPPGEVKLRPLVGGADSSDSGFTDGPTGSRQTVYLGKAVMLACRDAKEKIANHVSKIIGVPPGSIEVKGGRAFYKDDPKRFVAISDLFPNYHVRARGISSRLDQGNDFIGFGTGFKEAGKQDPESGKCISGRISPYYQSIAAGAEVSVNPGTGQLKVRRIVCAMDVGTAINPSLVRGQMLGAVMMGLSSTLSESCELLDGRFGNSNLADYKLLTSADAPIIETVILETKYKDGPHGAKGAGEAAIMPIAAAVRNAVHDALGVWINELPITPEKILAANKELQGSQVNGKV